jgi:hypothetical protein
MKKYRFFYHYRHQTKGMTVHYKGQCIPCKNIICQAATETKWNSGQPTLVMRGFATGVKIDGDTVIILN